MERRPSSLLGDAAEGLLLLIFLWEMGRKSLGEVMVTGEVSAPSLSRVSAAFPGLGMGWSSPLDLGDAELQLNREVK